MLLVEDLDLLLEWSDRREGGREEKVGLHIWGAGECLRRSSCHRNLSACLQSRQSPSVFAACCSSGVASLREYF